MTSFIYTIILYKLSVCQYKIEYIYQHILIYISILYKGNDIMKDINIEPLKIKKRGEDGYKLISVRIKEDTLSELDKIASETNYSRNELINEILRHGVRNIITE